MWASPRGLRLHCRQIENCSYCRIAVVVSHQFRVRLAGFTAGASLYESKAVYRSTSNEQSHHYLGEAPASFEGGHPIRPLGFFPFPFPLPLTFCPGSGFVDTTMDSDNCGACGRKCASNQTCCESVCVPNQQHCGGCGPAFACASNEACCLAADGEVECVDIVTDPFNCGGCGKACPPFIFNRSEQFCCAQGQCASASNNFLLSDSKNCGTCGFDCTRSKELRPSRLPLLIRAIVAPLARTLPQVCRVIFHLAALPAAIWIKSNARSTQSKGDARRTSTVRKL